MLSRTWRNWFKLNPLFYFFAPPPLFPLVSCTLPFSACGKDQLLDYSTTEVRQKGRQGKVNEPVKSRYSRPGGRWALGSRLGLRNRGRVGGAMFSWFGPRTGTFRFTFCFYVVTTVQACVFALLGFFFFSPIGFKSLGIIFSLNSFAYTTRRLTASCRRMNNTCSSIDLGTKNMQRGTK